MMDTKKCQKPFFTQVNGGFSFGKAPIVRAVLSLLRLTLRPLRAYSHSNLVWES